MRVRLLFAADACRRTQNTVILTGTAQVDVSWGNPDDVMDNLMEVKS